MRTKDETFYTDNKQALLKYDKMKNKIYGGDSDTNDRIILIH